MTEREREKERGREKQGDGRLKHRLAKDSYIDPYLLYLDDSILRAPLCASSALRPRVHSPPSRVSLNTASALPWVWLQLADCEWPRLSVPVYLHTFFRFIIHVNLFRLSIHGSCLPVYTAGTYYPRNSWLTAFLKTNMQYMYYMISSNVQN